MEISLAAMPIIIIENLALTLCISRTLDLNSTHCNLVVEINKVWEDSTYVYMYTVAKNVSCFLYYGFQTFDWQLIIIKLKYALAIQNGISFLRGIILVRFDESLFC